MKKLSVIAITLLMSICAFAQSDFKEKTIFKNDEVEIRLTVIKPAAQLNKEVQVRIGDMFVEKKCDSFEDGINECLEALDKQIERRKER